MSVVTNLNNNFWTILQQKQKRYVATVAMALEYLALQLAPTTYHPDMIIAGMPVYHVQKEGHAASDEILKYRSMGTIFLAHQKGGKRTFKCTLKINGPARLYVLGFLQYLQRSGVQEDYSLGTYFSQTILDESMVQDPFIPPGANSKVKYIQDYENIERETIAYHKTFPIITDTKIYTNMYLETLRYTEDVKLGIETMEIDCAFREFIAPMHIRWYKPKKEDDVGYFSTWITDEERNSLRRIDLFLNVFWGIKSVIGEVEFKQIEQKQMDQYTIEAGILATGALLSITSLW